MRDDAIIGVDDHDLDDATLEALADAFATPPRAALRGQVLAAARRETVSTAGARAVRRWRAVGAIAAVAALMLGGLAARQSRLAGVRAIELAAVARTNAELSSRLDEQGRTLADLREAVAAQGQVLHVLAGPHTLTATLAPKESGVHGGGRVVVDAASGEGAVVLSGLESLGRDRAYELWAIRGKRPPEPSGVFTVEAGRPLAARVEPVARPKEVTAFAISIEPAGGSKSPTGPIVLVGAVAS